MNNFTGKVITPSRSPNRVVVTTPRDNTSEKHLVVKIGNEAPNTFAFADPEENKEPTVIQSFIKML